MKFIKRYEKCWGLSFPAIGRWKIEIWLALPKYEIAEHTHPNQDIKLIFLFGNNIRFHRRRKSNLLGESFLATLSDIGRIFTINAGDSHYFTVSNWPLLFMNIEKWHIEPTSAADDLVLTTN